MNALESLLLYKEAKDRDDNTKSYAIPAGAGAVGLGAAAYAANDNRRMLNVLLDDKRNTDGKILDKEKDKIIKNLIGDAATKSGRESNKNAAKYYRNKVITKGGLAAGVLGLGYGAYQYNKNKRYEY